MRGVAKGRGEQRRKPWYRPRNVVLVVVLAIVGAVGWMVWETVRLADAEPNPAVDYRAKFAAMSRSAAGVSLEEAQASWDFLEEVGRDYSAVVQQIDAATKAGLYGRFDYEPRWTHDRWRLDFTWVLEREDLDDRLDRERSALQRLEEQGVFGRFRALAERPVAVDSRPADGMMMKELVPQLSQLRHLAKAHLAAARLSFERGDDEDSIAGFQQCVWLSRALAHHRFLVSRLVAITIESLTMREIRYEILEGGFDADASRRLLAVLAAAELPPVSLAFEGERMFVLDTVQWTFSDDGDGNGYLLPREEVLSEYRFEAGGSSDLMDVFWCRFVAHDRKATVDWTNQYMDRVIDACELPFREGSASMRRLEEEANAFLDDHSDRNPIIAHMLSPLSAVFESDASSRMFVRATTLMVAIDGYQKQHGALPADLAALVPEWLSRVPTDPISASQFRYVLLDAPDGYGREYLLYSLGLDGEDNAGREIDIPFQHPRHALTLPDYAGFDYVINRPRPEW